jgi:hypothetical protein
MRPSGRKKAITGAMALALLFAALVSAMPVQSLSGGIDSSAGGAGLGSQRGCYCHSPDGSSKVPNGRAAINFAFVGGIPGGYYQAQATYTIVLAFDDPDVPMNPDPTANHGGFNVWPSGGTFVANGSAWVQVQADTSISHTKTGDVEANRTFKFDWKAPAANTSDVTFDILVNAVNGDNVNTGGNDHWSRLIVVIPGLPGASSGSVDISKLGVPLRAYWLGIIGILSTMFLVLLSFYVIRSGSKFYEFGLPRGQVKSVKLRTIPPPKNKGAYAVMAGLMALAVIIGVIFLSVRDEQLDALNLSLFILGFFGVIALAAFYYIRAFLPIVDVLEEEEILPLQ